MEENGSCRAAFCESAALQGKIFADFQRAELPQSKPDGFDSSLREGAFGMARKFPTKAQSLHARKNKKMTRIIHPFKASACRPEQFMIIL